MKISQSDLDKFDNCPRSLQYSIENPAYFGGSVRAVGTAYHAGLEYFYQHRGRPDFDFDCREQALEECIDRAHDTFRAELEVSDEFVWDEEAPDEDEAFRRIDAMLTHYFTATGPDGTPIPWPEEFEVIGTETPFELRLSDDVVITSRGIDLTLRDPNGWIIGVDHKTTKGKMWDQFKHLPRKKAQGPLYTWAMRQLWPDAPGYRFVYDVMTAPGKRETTLPKFERRIADCTDAQIEATLKRVADAAFAYTNYRANGLELPAVPSSTLCSAKYCDFFSICPFGATLEE